MQLQYKLIPYDDPLLTKPMEYKDLDNKEEFAKNLEKNTAEALDNERKLINESKTKQAEANKKFLSDQAAIREKLGLTSLYEYYTKELRCRHAIVCSISWLANSRISTGRDRICQ